MISNVYPVVVVALKNASSSSCLLPERDFSESAAWACVGEGWKPLSGNFRDLGFSVEWHDFVPQREFAWSNSFHPQSVEICLNLAGTGSVKSGCDALEFSPLTAGFYIQSQPELTARRERGERHQFLTVELSFDFVAQHVGRDAAELHPALKKFFRGESQSAVSEPVRLSSDDQALANSLGRPPVAKSAQRLWYRAKALEVASSLLFRPESGSELFCQRHHRQNHERVERVLALLRENLAEPPTLEDIGRRVGCSHYYLSRIFSQEMGHGIFQHLRTLRLERAAELLREKKLNVTQVALEVGYNSPSHFSSAFHQMFGCCPGLYPLRTLTRGTGLARD